LVASLPFEHRYTVDPRGLISFYQSVNNWSPYLADYRLKNLEHFLLDLANKTAEQEEENARLKAAGKTGIPYGGWELDKWIPNYTDYVQVLIKQLRSFSYSAKYPGTKASIEDNQMYYYRPDKSGAKEAIANFMEHCHSSICKDQQKGIFLEDNTWSILFANDLFDLTPHAKMVHIVRDPRDVIASMQKQHWTPGTLDQLLTYYTDIMNQWDENSQCLSSNQQMTVRLEDLVSYPESTLSNICSFVEIEPEEALLSIDLSKSNRGRYLDQFTKAEISMMESRLTPYMTKYNYT